MAQIPPVSNSYVGDGITKIYDIDFVFLKKSEVFANVNGVPAPFTWLAGSDSSIEFVTAPPALAIIRVYRSTLAYTTLHIFQNGVPFLPRYIDENNKQMLYVAQEATFVSTAAMDIANEVLVRINAAEDVADLALLTSNEAKSIANNANTNAGIALTQASQAKTIAEGIDAKATQALTTANAADAKADEALEAVQQAGVASFNGRAGIVVPGNADYTSGMIGYKTRDVQARLDELVSVVDYADLRSALATGAMVRVPATVPTLTVSAADTPFVLPQLYRISAEGDLTIYLEAGTHTVAMGDLMRVGVRNSTIKVVGVAPTETKATAVASITGSANDWSITYNVPDTVGAAVGDYAKLFDAGPLPVLNGDNAASYVLREYPQKGELSAPPSFNVGPVSIVAGTNVATFLSVGAGKALTDFMKVGDLLTAYGQTREIQTVSTTSVTVIGNWTKSTANLPAYYITRASAGTIGTGGVASATVTGTGSNFAGEGNPGDVLLVNGALVRILTITGAGTMLVDMPVTITNGTKYTILQSAACLHEGVHEITAVSGSTITVRNRCPIKPPIVGVTVDEFRIIKTVLKQTGAGDGIVCDQNGSLRELNNVVLCGPGSGGGVGLLLQSRIPAEVSSGGTSFGDVTQHGLRGTILLGENVGVTRFLRGAMVGHGCLLNGRKLAVTNNQGFGVWVIDGGYANLRRACISGGSIGLLVNSGGGAVITEVRLCGTTGDGLRSDANASVYGEAPMAVACGGMGYRVMDSSKAHWTDGVALLCLSGFYLDGGSARIDRTVVGANTRCGLEGTEQVDVRASYAWVSGTSNTAGPGYGVQLGSGSTLVAVSATITGNEVADVAIPAIAAGATAILQTCNYGTLSGVVRVNSPNNNGSVVWDTSGVDTGSSVPTIGAASGTGGTVSAVGFKWTRDKDRYYFDGRVTVNTLGTWAGYLTMSLPFTAAEVTPFIGVNLTTGAVVSGHISGNEARIYAASGAPTFPVAAGATLSIGGNVRA